MKKINWGINGAKLNAYLKMIRKENRTAVLRTVRDGNDEDHVWLLTDFLALRVPEGYLYKEIIQPYTMTDAPEFGESKTVVGPERDGTSLASNAEDLVMRAEKVAYDTRFSLDIAHDKKWRSLSLFALDDGTPVVLNADYAGIFERKQFITYWGSGRYAPIIIKGEYGITGIVMPVRLSAENEEKARAVCQFFKAPERRAEQAA